MIRRVQKYIFVLFIFAISNTVNPIAQEIDFGQYSSLYAVSITDLTPATDLDFGIVLNNQGPAVTNIMEAEVISIEGVKYLDVIVDISADEYLLLNGDLACQTNPSCRIPFTLNAAYANRGTNNTAQAVQINVLSGNTASSQFAIKYRGSAPPGPPPTPVYEGYNPALFNETAFLYIYGFLNVGTVNAGSYEGNINVTISYD